MSQLRKDNHLDRIGVPGIHLLNELTGLVYRYAGFGIAQALLCDCDGIE
jgi:hypothetical protein